MPGGGNIDLTDGEDDPVTLSAGGDGAGATARRHAPPAAQGAWAKAGSGTQRVVPEHGHLLVDRMPVSSRFAFQQDGGTVSVRLYGSAGYRNVGDAFYHNRPGRTNNS